MAVGIRRAGLPGGLAAWLGFTLPSALLLVGFAALVGSGTIPDTGRLVAGLQLAAVAIVAAAVVWMARSLTPDVPRAGLALAAAVVVLLLPTGVAQLVVLIVGAVIGWLILAPVPIAGSDDGRRLATIPGRTAALALGLFAVLLVGLPLGARLGLPGAVGHGVALAAAFYVPGSLVFGGGHVVLPLLDATVVDPGWVGQGVFLAGYGAAQAVPGPLFSFAAYLGALSGPAPNGILGAGIALVAIFLPGALLLVAALAAWDRLGTLSGIRRAIAGVDAAVVGILGAALWDPVIRTGIHGPADGVIALLGLALLLTSRVPPLAVVGLGVVAGFALPALGLSG